MASRQAAGAPSDQSFGLMRIGEALVALSAGSIREVISGQATYSALPVKAEGLLGAVDVRGTIIPVLDLRHTLGFELKARPAHVIVIMRWDGSLIGLTADDVCGIARVQDKDLFTLTTASGASRATIATHSFQDNGTIITLLDAQRIAELPNVPLVMEKRHDTGDSLSVATETIVLFSYEDSQFGIDATFVHATVPAVKIERNALSMGYCLGVIPHHGYDVPVVDMREALGLAEAHTPRQETTVIIIRFSEQAMLGFAIDTVHDIVRAPESDILHMPSLQMDSASLFRGILVDASGRQNLLLDINGLRAEPNLRFLAGLRKPRMTPEGSVASRSNAVKAADKSDERTTPFLTYVAGAQQASPLGQIMEILHYPADVAPFAASESGMLGLFTHRGRVAPLVCLATLLGRPKALDLSEARVLFVEDGERSAGFVVESLLSIEAATRHLQAAKPGGEDLGRFQYLVTIGIGDQSRLVSHIDLTKEIAQFYREADLTSSITMAAVIDIERRSAAI